MKLFEIFDADNSNGPGAGNVNGPATQVSRYNWC